MGVTEVGASMLDSSKKKAGLIGINVKSDGLFLFCGTI